jgi:AcrR family transcriptional regulator
MQFKCKCYLHPVMTTQRLPSRQRLINAALELFAAQGVTETTTRQIAEVAGVNEVTLFRQFGNKHGLLLAVLEEAAVFSSLGAAWTQQDSPASSLEQALQDYAASRLEALAAIPEFVRSLVGEAGQYPAENRQALGDQITQANRFVAQYLETVIRQGQLQTRLPAEKIASLLNSLLLGYAVLELTSEFHQLWRDRHDFLESLVNLFLHGAVAQHPEINPSPPVADLPAALVHSLLQQAKKLGVREYALMYVLFGAGLSPQEVTQLQRVHHLSNRHQHLLEVPGATARQVPINQWILGKRYGSYSHNPLTQWLKSRKDQRSALFANFRI